MIALTVDCAFSQPMRSTCRRPCCRFRLHSPVQHSPESTKPLAGVPLAMWFCAGHWATILHAEVKLNRCLFLQAAAAGSSRRWMQPATGVLTHTQGTFATWWRVEQCVVCAQPSKHQWVGCCLRWRCPPGGSCNTAGSLPRTATMLCFCDLQMASSGKLSTIEAGHPHLQLHANTIKGISC